MPRSFQEVDIPRYPDSQPMKVVRLSAGHIGRFYPQDIFLILISVRGWVSLRANVWLEGLCQWKIPLTPSGIKPMTFWIVVQCFNQLHHHVPHMYYSLVRTVDGNIYLLPECLCFKIHFHCLKTQWSLPMIIHIAMNSLTLIVIYMYWSFPRLIY